MIAAALLLLQAAMPPSTLVARLESLLGRTAPPMEGTVAVITTPSVDTVFVGDQVEILTTAWFPASVRERLRRPPTLRPPTLSGVWSLPVVTLQGVAASRTVGETVYDLFASHQVVFPVAAGRITIPAAELGFSVPGGRQYFGDERRDLRRSAERTIVVRDLPARGRPTGFAGPVARDLRVVWRLATPNARVGELLTVDVLVSGEGNLSLWGSPAIGWPDGFRVYPDRVAEAPDWRGSRLGGVRRFRFQVLADSAGSVTLPALRYPYFDSRSATYREATAPAMVVPILPSIAPPEPRSPPPFAVERGPALPRVLVDRWWAALVILGLLAPLAGWSGGGWWRRRALGLRRPPRAQAVARFEHLLGELVREGDLLEPTRLASALRRAGITRQDAEAATALHEQLRRLRFARPDQRVGREEVLSEEVARWLERLPAPVRRQAWRAGIAAVLLIVSAPAIAQAPSPAALYAEGAWEAAATAQQAEVTRQPASATAWYNLGSARWMARHDAAAAAAWLEALRLSPRHGQVRRAWSDLALRHQQVRPLAPRVPVTPEELVLAGLLAWMAGAVVLAARRRLDRVALGGVVAGVLLLGIGLGIREARQRPMGLTRQEVALQLSPHGLAPTVGTLDGFVLVPIEAAAGSWLRVRDARGRQGWLPAGTVARVRGLD